MSVFLESAKTVKKVNVYAMTESVEASCSSFNESLAYSEIGWQNILMSAMNEEFHVITEANENGKEGKSGIIATLKAWFMKAIEWLKSVFAKIKEWFNNVRSKLSPSFILIKKFAVSHEKEIIAGATNAQKDGAVVRLNNWVSAGGNKVPSTKEIYSHFVFGGNDNIQKTFEKVDEVVKSLIRNENGNTSKEYKVTVDLAKNAVSTAKNADKDINTISGVMKKVEMSAKQMNTEAQKGANTNDETQAAAQKEKVTKHKTGLIAKNRAISSIVSLASKVVRDAHRVNTICYKYSKKKDTTNANETPKKKK